MDRWMTRQTETLNEYKLEICCFSKLKHVFLSVKYNHITCHQQELQNITYFHYQSMSSVEIAVEYNNLLQSKDFKETFTSTATYCLIWYSSS